MAPIETSEKGLEEYARELTGAIEAATRSDSAASGRTEDPLVDGFLSSPLHAASLAISIADGMAGNKNAAGPQSGQNGQIITSRFIAAQQQRRMTGVSLTPLSYLQKRAQALRERAELFKKRKRDGELLSRSRLTGTSLTGSGTADGKAAPVKGMKVSMANAASIPTDLIAELAFTLGLMDGDKRFTKSDKRLTAEAGKGTAAAKSFMGGQKPVMSGAS